MSAPRQGKASLCVHLHHRPRQLPAAGQSTARAQGMGLLNVHLLQLCSPTASTGGVWQLDSLHARDVDGGSAKSHAGCGVCELCVECTHCQCGGLAADEEDSPTADDKEGPRYRPSQKARASHHAWLQRGGPLGPDPSYPARTPPATIGTAEEASSGDFGLRRGAAEVGCTTCTTRTSDQSMH